MVDTLIKKVLNYLQSHKILTALLAGATIITLAVVFFFKPASKPTPTPPSSSAQQTSWKGLTPGVSTKENVLTNLGTPLSESETGATYKSNSPVRPHEVIFSNNTAEFIKEIIYYKDKVKFNALRDKYGVAQYTLYGPDAYNGYNLYAYPEKGVAFIGNPNNNYVLEIWYFPATSIKEFKAKWATAYSEQLLPQF